MFVTAASTSVAVLFVLGALGACGSPVRDLAAHDFQCSLEDVRIKPGPTNESFDVEACGHFARYECTTKHRVYGCQQSFVSDRPLVNVGDPFPQRGPAPQGECSRDGDCDLIHFEPNAQDPCCTCRVIATAHERDAGLGLDCRAADQDIGQSATSHCRLTCPATDRERAVCNDGQCQVGH